MNPRLARPEDDAETADCGCVSDDRGQVSACSLAHREPEQGDRVEFDGYRYLRILTVDSRSVTIGPVFFTGETEEWADLRVDDPEWQFKSPASEAAGSRGRNR